MPLETWYAVVNIQACRPFFLSLCRSNEYGFILVVGIFDCFCINRQFGVSHGAKQYLCSFDRHLLLQFHKGITSNPW